MAIVIVFTIYKNGGNAGVLGASFGCAVFSVRGSSGVNAGALCSTGAASSALTPPVRFRLALLRARGLLCVRRAEPKPLSKRRRVEPFSFRPSA